MDFGSLVVAILVGGAVGWLASLLMKTNAQMGLVANVVVGIAGSALGHWLAPRLGIAASGTVMQWVVAVGGAVLLIFLLKLLRVFK